MRTAILVILNMVYIFLLVAVMLFVDLKPSEWQYWFGVFLCDICIADIAKYLTREFKAKA